MEYIKKKILQATTTRTTTGCTGTCRVIIPNTGVTYHINFSLTQNIQDIGFFDAYIVPPLTSFIVITSKNYPNPLNPTTIISYQLPVNSFVTLNVYDVIGREVRTLVNGPKASGSYTVEFDGSDLPSGVYFYRLRAGDFTSVKKLILLK